MAGWGKEIFVSRAAQGVHAAIASLWGTVRTVCLRWTKQLTGRVSAACSSASTVSIGGLRCDGPFC